VDTVSNLRVSRTKNDKSLVARWEKLVSELPVGEIVVYQIEYRNRGKDIIMTARISATFDFFSILELEDASAYEVGTVCRFSLYRMYLYYWCALIGIRGNP
jgi:intein/homing endonuclease